MQYTLFRSSCNAKPCLPIAYKTPGTGSHKVANWKILTNVGSNQDSHLKIGPTTNQGSANQRFVLAGYNFFPILRAQHGTLSQRWLNAVQTSSTLEQHCASVELSNENATGTFLHGSDTQAVEQEVK